MGPHPACSVDQRSKRAQSHRLGPRLRQQRATRLARWAVRGRVAVLGASLGTGADMPEGAVPVVVASCPVVSRATIAATVRNSAGATWDAVMVPGAWRKATGGVGWVDRIAEWRCAS